MKPTVILLLIVTAIIAFTIRVCWQESMPDDGSKVCSFQGEGYVVANGLTGVFLRRREAMDDECKARMK